MITAGCLVCGDPVNDGTDYCSIACEEDDALYHAGDYE